jgi:hypothetical protein
MSYHVTRLAVLKAERLALCTRLAQLEHEISLVNESMNETLCLEAALLVEHEQSAVVGMKRARPDVKIVTGKEPLFSSSLEE